MLCVAPRKLLFSIHQKTVFFFVFLFPLFVFAQNKEVTGTVKDEDGKLLSGISVRPKNKPSAGMVTDSTGRFSLKITQGDILLVSSVNYEEQEVPVTAKNNYAVTLKAITKELDDVVVIGYGSMRKRDVTGSVEKINIGDLQKAPVGSFAEGLAGRAAGVVVSSGDGQPGSMPQIVIRGNNSISQDNSPLYVIDGFPLENPNNNVINPADIESLEILKDASATAIYGARGANGVILITTKKGKAGPTVISFNAYVGFQKMTKKMDLMNPYEFISYQREKDSLANNFYLRPGGLSGPGYVTDSVYLRYSSLDDYKSIAGTDFQDKVFRTSPFRNYDISVSGGNQQTRFSISGNIFDQKGIMINSDYKRYQGRFNIENMATSKLRIGLNLNASNVVLNGQSPTYINSGNSNSALSLLTSVWGYRPVSGTLPNGQPDESLSDNLFDNSVAITDYRINPYLNQSHILSRDITNSIFVNAFAEYKMLPELTLRMNGSINYVNRAAQQFYDSSTILGSIRTGAGSTFGVNGQVINYKTNILSNENILTYNKIFSKVHSVMVTGVMSVQKATNSSQGHRAIFVPNQSLGIDGLDEGTPVSITAYSSTSTLASFAGRVNYDYKKRYFFAATYRADGSSKFSPQNKWSYFPSGAFKWRISDENFFKPLKNKFWSDANLRITYGLSGNNRVSDFAYLSPILVGTTSPYESYVFNNTIITGATPASLGNVNLKWETTSQLNAGVDLSFFNNRITFVADVYRKKTKDLLLNAVIPASLGYTTAYKNIGSIQNQGLELSLNASIIKNQKFSWNASFNISWNQSKVLSLTENQESILNAVPFDRDFVSLPAYITKLGQPLGQMYGLVWDGVYQYSDFNYITAVNASASNAGTGSHWVLKDNVSTNGAASTRGQVQPGDIKYKDLNGDGVITTADYTVIGRGLPIHTGGFNNNFAYGRFDLNIFFQWSYGNDIQNANRIIFEGNAPNRAFFNQYAAFNNRWTPENQTNEYFRTSGAGPAAYSSRTIEDGSYLRLKTVQLGYTLPVKILNRAKIKSFRLYASVQNLFTVTGYSGPDPEINVNNSVLTPGFDYSPYPRARTVVFGLNLTF